MLLVKNTEKTKNIHQMPGSCRNLILVPEGNRGKEVNGSAVNEHLKRTQFRVGACCANKV
jgi:hypothetical protein